MKKGAAGALFVAAWREESDLFHFAQQSAQAILPYVLFFFQLLVFAHQRFVVAGGSLNFLRQRVVFVFQLFNFHLQQGDGINRLLYFCFQFLKYFK